MLIRFISPTNIRNSAFEHSVAPIGVVNAGVELEVDNRLYRGLEIDGIDTYFKDKNGWYYWSGRAVILYKALPPPKKHQEDPYEEIGGVWQLEKSTPVAPDQITQPESSNNPAPIQNSASLVTDAPLERMTDREQKSVDLPEPIRHWAIRQLEIDTLFWESQELYGKNIRAMLLGTGVNTTQPDFSARIINSANFCNPKESMVDADGSGTVCAGILAGAGQVTWQGVAPQTELLIGKIMRNSLDFDYQRLKESLEWCREIKPEILLFCFDFRGDSIREAQRAEIIQILSEITKTGTLCIAPAGNGVLGSRPESRWPASLETCLSVGAFDNKLLRMASSLRSHTLDILAPGEGLYQENTTSPVASTTQAAAFTAGVAALGMEYAIRNKITIGSTTWMQVLKTSALAKYERTKCSDIEYGCGCINPPGLLKTLIGLNK
jgi:hypothetical protein